VDRMCVLQGNGLGPFKMIRAKIPGLSSWTLDELGAKMKCDKCGKRPERYYPAKQSDAPGVCATVLRSGELVPWHQTFFDPIELPGGRKLVTLRDAARYIMKLAKAEQQAAPWQTAAEVLMLVGEHGGDPMMAHIAMMQALHRHQPRAASAPRRKRAKVYRIVR
jgi:hypothetical protein